MDQYHKADTLAYEKWRALLIRQEALYREPLREVDAVLVVLAKRHGCERARGYHHQDCLDCSPNSSSVPDSDHGDKGRMQAFTWMKS